VVLFNIVLNLPEYTRSILPRNTLLQTPKMADECAYCKDGITPTGQICPFCGKKEIKNRITRRKFPVRNHSIMDENGTDFYLG